MPDHVAQPWCVVDTKDQKSKCLRCGTEEPIDFPMTVTEMVESTKAFLDEHADCSSWWFVYDSTTAELTIGCFTQGNDYIYIIGYGGQVRLPEDGFHLVAPVEVPHG